MIEAAPTGVAALCDRLTRDLPSARVHAERLTGRRWKIAATSTRVHLWLEYDALSRGRLSFKRTELHVDGQRVPPVNQYEQLIQLFADPDGDCEQPQPQPAAITTAPTQQSTGVRVRETHVIRN